MSRVSPTITARAAKRFAASVTIILDTMRARQVVNACAIPVGREIIVQNVSAEEFNEWIYSLLNDLIEMVKILFL